MATHNNKDTFVKSDSNAFRQVTLKYTPCTCCHAINQLTHDFSRNMGYIFLVFYFPSYLTLALRARANKWKIKNSKNISHISLKIMR